MRFQLQNTVRPAAAAPAACAVEFPSTIGYAREGRGASGAPATRRTISRRFLSFPSAYPSFLTLFYIFLDSNLLLPRRRHQAPQPPDRSAEHRIVGRRRGAARPRAGAALRPSHRPHGESLERWGLLERVRAQEELHDSDGGLLVGGGVVLGARGGVDAAPAPKKVVSRRLDDRVFA